MTVRVFGSALGAESDTRRMLAELVARAGVDPTSATLAQLAYRRMKRDLAEPDPDSIGKPEPGHVYAKSEFFRAPLSAETIAALVEHISRRRAPDHSRELDFTPWGGAYNRVPPGATAFPHRAERFLLKHEVVVAAPAAQAATPAAREWLAKSWALAHRAGGGGAYVNFPDADLSPWDRAYHGANLERLLEVKARYDPDDLFRATSGTA